MRIQTVLPLIALSARVLWVASASASAISATFTDLPLATQINLTNAATQDWVKWGNNENNGSTSYATVRKSGVTTIINSALTPVGSAPPNAVTLAAYSAGNVLKFNWTDGNSPANGVSDTVVTETVLPAQNSYPIGLGASATALASAQTREFDVWVQGFNADMRVTAALSGGGSSSVVVSPTKHLPADARNFYSSGIFDVLYSGAGETLTISVQTMAPTAPGPQQSFPNAGIFAMSVGSPKVGDFNRDGRVNAADIPVMLSALTDLDTYKTTYTLSDANLALIGDINGDGALNNADVQSFLNERRCLI